MSELIKVEIDIVKGEERDYQWMGLLSNEDLKALCAVADTLSDISVEEASNE